jgi:nitrile hydratase beta subunit
VRGVNGPHDVGGRHGFGPVRAERDEPVFHADWEARVCGISCALDLVAPYTVDQFRYAIERMGPRAYLDSSYYEKWLAALERLLEDKGIVARAEIDARGDAPLPPPADPDSELARLVADGLAGRLFPPPEFTLDAAPRFAPGDAVRARNLQTKEHLRLPAYAKNHVGTVAAHRGPFPHPEWSARFGEARPAHEYTVRFEAGELWGDTAEHPRDAVHIDLFEDYLERA